MSWLRHWAAVHPTGRKPSLILQMQSQGGFLLAGMKFVASQNKEMRVFFLRGNSKSGTRRCSKLPPKMLDLKGLFWLGPHGTVPASATADLTFE